MKKSIQDILMSLNRRTACKTSSLKKLQTISWIKTTFHDYKVSPETLQSNVFKKGDDDDASGIVYKWLRGEHHASKTSVNRVAEQYPGSGDIFNSPIFQLLENKRITKAKLEKIISPYLSEPPLRIWHLPFDDQNVNGLPVSLITHEIDSDTLFQRGDIYGFMAILYLVRKAEIENDLSNHIFYMKDAYRAFPAFCKNRYFNHNWDDYLTALVKIQSRMSASLYLLIPDFDTIKRQALSQQLITLRVLRPMDPMTHRFIPLKEPYREASFDFS